MFANNNHLVIYHQATLVLQVFVNLYSAMQLLLVVVLNLLSEICHLLSSSRWLRTTLLTCTVPQRIYRQTVANPTEKNIINVDLVLIYIPELKLLSHTYCWGVYTAASTTGQPFPQLYHTWQLHCRRPPFQHLHIGTKL